MFPVRARWGWFSIVWKARHGQSRPAGNGQTEEQLHLPLDEEHRPRAGRPGSVWSLSGPCLARRWRPPSQPKAGKLAPAQFSHRAPRQAACRKSDLWLPLLIPIRGHVDLPGISDRAVYTAFSATFWSSAFFFSFLFVVAAPNLPRPRGPDRVGCRLAAALPVPGSPARAGPRRAAGCSGGRVGGRCRWALLGPSAWTPVSGVSGGDARVQALLPGRARETFLRLALCFAREREPGAALRLPD